MKTLAALSVMSIMTIIPLAAPPAQAQISLNLSVDVAPPPLPIYDQPPIPGPDYIWVPGYWAWDDYVEDYYWIPGTWVMAPRPGLLWTPAWWGWEDGIYLFHAGYWAPHVGFYGGVNYGFGYTGSGYQGAYWNGPHVFYNRSVTNITNVNVTNVYNKTVIVNRVTNVSYNGGPGGVQARPSFTEQQAMHEPHVAPTAMQQQHFQAARTNRQLFASANHGRPPIAATSRAAQFHGPGAMATRQAPPYHPPQNRPGPSGAPAGFQPHGSPVPARSAPAGTIEHSAASQPAMHPAENRPPDIQDRRPTEFARPPAPRPNMPEAAREMRQMRPEQPHAAAAPQRPQPPRRPPAPPHEQPRQPPHTHPQGGGHPKPPPHENHH